MYSNNQKLKRVIGRALVAICQRFPQARRPLGRFGLRTKKEWFPHHVVRLQLPGGAGLKLASFGTNYFSFELFWRGVGYYEPITTLLLNDLVEPDGTFIDLGANIGFYSLILSITRPGLRVVAFEPNPRNHELLRLNAQANDLPDLVCERFAISDHHGLATLYLSASDMSASLQSDFEDHERGEVIVSTTTLDRYLESHPAKGRLTIKVDVEGHEEAFFRGASHTLQTLRPDIISEVALNYSPDIVVMLREIGYRFYPITDQGLKESLTITPTVRGNLLFLNYLISARPRPTLRKIFEGIAPKVRRIDLSRTSKYRDDAAVQAFNQRVQMAPRPEQPGGLAVQAVRVMEET